MVQNTRVKRALSRKQVGVTPVSNTGIKPHTGDSHQYSPDKTPLGYCRDFVYSINFSFCLFILGTVYWY